MKIFLSYPVDEREVVERVHYALLAQGHDVFFDRADLAPGHEFDQTIARGIAASDLFVFFVTPTSVTPGRYTLTELRLAEQKWPHASGHVFPVMLRPTDMNAVPAYLRAVHIFTPGGNAVADTSHEVARMVRALPLTTRLRHRLRTPSGIAALVAVAVVLAAGAMALGRPNALGFLGLAATDRSVIATLPADVRRRARAVAATADGGFALGVADPAQVLRFSPTGQVVGNPVWLAGEPVTMSRTPKDIVVITRARDGITALDWKDLRIIDTLRFDPARVERYRGTAPRLSAEIRSVAVGGSRNSVWVVTGDRDGTPAVVRYVWIDPAWTFPTWAADADSAGLLGERALGLELRTIAGDIWAVRPRPDASSLYHFVDLVRVDKFEGEKLRMVRCADDVAESAAGNLLILSCENELQEIRALGPELTLLSARPTVPSAGPGVQTHELIVPDSQAVVIALNDIPGVPNDSRPRARVIELDSAGTVVTLFDVRDATVQSMAVTPRGVAAVLRRGDGSADVAWVHRAGRALER